MFGSPTHEVKVIYKDNKKVSMMIADFSSKEEFKKEVKRDYEERLNCKGEFSKENNCNPLDWKTVQYCTFDKEQRVIYECSIEEILKEN